MFNKKTSDETVSLESVIDALRAQILNTRIGTEDYDKMVTQLSTLYKLKEFDSKKHVSMDTKAMVIGNLAGILLILGYEHVHVVTSKALSFVLKSK